MTSKQRMLTALNGGIPDRLPVTSHHVMSYFLKRYMNGMTTQEFFDHFNLDAILWTVPIAADHSKGFYLDPTHYVDDILYGRRVISDNWRIEWKEIPGKEYQTTRYQIITPKGTLDMELQSNEQTSWIMKHLVKDKSDIEIIAEYVTYPLCDVKTVNKLADEFGERGIIRGHIACFDIYGQPGCWQDAACLYGIENLIMATFDDPGWVHEFLKILQSRKIEFIKSLEGARYDILELGGGDASSTVISPKIFNEFVAPYDSVLIELAHSVGQKIAYHTCGGMMPILENIAAMNPDAMETFTPPDMGGDVNLAEAKKRIGDKVCMIGGFDQFHFFQGCTPDETRAEVRRCFEEAGGGGGFIISPSDHFFDAEPELIMAYAEEAKNCVY